RGVLRDEGGTARPNVGGGLLRVPARLRTRPREPVAGRVRRRHRLRVVRRDPPAHPGPVLAGQARDPLRLMSAAIAPAEVSTAPARLDPRALPGESGMVERKRNRVLPFDPWHLFLAPLAVVMLLPMVWMAVTSLET